MTPGLTIAGLANLVEVGRGGFAVVYRADQPALGRQVAVKVQSVRMDDRGQQRFKREQQALGRLCAHPHVVDVYDAGITADGAPYLLMEFLSRGSLQDRVSTGGPLPWRDVTAIGIHVAGALETAHRAGIVHRDVKPANILLSDTGEPLLADFGIARLGSGFETSVGTALMSLLYAAPELLDGAAPSPTSDLYALAATLFSLLCGTPPFARSPGESMAALYVRMATAPVPDLRPRGVPAVLCEVLEGALAKEPSGRPSSAFQFAEQLQDLQRVNGDAVTPLVVWPFQEDQDHSGSNEVTVSDAASATTGTVARRRIAWWPTVALVVAAVGVGVGVPAPDVGDLFGSRAQNADRIAGLWKGLATVGDHQRGVQLDVRRGCHRTQPCGAISVSDVPCFGRVTLADTRPDGGFDFVTDQFFPGSSPTQCQAGGGDVFTLQDDGRLLYTPTYDTSLRMTLDRVGAAAE